MYMTYKHCQQKHSMAFHIDDTLFQWNSSCYCGFCFLNLKVSFIMQIKILIFCQKYFERKILQKTTTTNLAQTIMTCPYKKTTLSDSYMYGASSISLKYSLVWFSNREDVIFCVMTASFQTSKDIMEITQVSSCSQSDVSRECLHPHSVIKK